MPRKCSVRARPGYKLGPRCGRGGPIKISHPGAFSHYGYRVAANADSRHKSLTRVIKAKMTPGAVVKRLNALVVLNRNRSPALSKKFHSDMKWVQKTYHTNARSKPVKKSRSRNTRKGKVNRSKRGKKSARKSRAKRR
jgi:hypothetical protein